MDTNSLIIILQVLVLLSGLIVLIISLYNLKRDKEKLKILAKSLGMNYEENFNLSNKLPQFLQLVIKNISSWRISGVVDGLPCEIYEEAKGKRFFTLFTHTTSTPLSFEMEITRQGRLEGFFVKLLNLQDIEVGDAEFDKAFRIKGSNENAVKMKLKDLQLRKAMFHLHELNMELCITDKKIIIRYNGRLRDVNKFRDILHRIVSIAKLLYSEQNTYNPFV